MLKHFRTLTAAILYLSLTVKAGPIRIGNGGNGVISENKVYLLDLVEAGVEQEPYFLTPQADPSLQALIATSLDPKKFPVALITQKISDIKSQDQLMAQVLLSALQLTTWQFVDARLTPIGETTPIVAIDPENLVQVANRLSTVITIDKKYWQLMSPEHQAALVFHEMFFALIKPSPSSAPTSHQQSVYARKITGLAFSESILQKDSLTRAAYPLIPSRTLLLGLTGNRQAVLNNDILVRSEACPTTNSRSLTVSPEMLFQFADKYFIFNPIKNDKFIFTESIAEICSQIKADQFDVLFAKTLFQINTDNSLGNAGYNWLANRQPLGTPDLRKVSRKEFCEQQNLTRFQPFMDSMANLIKK